jgi:hypothetical protein
MIRIDFMKNFLKIPLIVPIALVLLLYSIFVFSMPKKPLAPDSAEAFAQINSYYGIDKGLPAYTEKSQNDQIKGDFIYRNVTLTINSPVLKNTNEFTFVLKIPVQTTKLSFPVLSLFTGFQTGSEAVDLIENQGDNILLGFQYPMPLLQDGHQWSWDWTAFESIPLLMTITMDWLHRQAYVDNNKINILSVSFGSIFTPLALRWLQMFNIRVKTTTLGYGGGDIPLIVGNELKNYFGKNETGFFKILLAHQTWMYEPKFHVANLNSNLFGNFLIVQGEQDTVFPPESIAVFTEKIPAQKKVVTLPGTHIQPNRQDLIKPFIETVRSFLLEQNAIN